MLKQVGISLSSDSIKKKKRMGWFDAKPKDDKSDEILAWSRVLEIVTDPTRELPDDSKILAKKVVDKLLKLISVESH